MLSQVKSVMACWVRVLLVRKGGQYYRSTAIRRTVLYCTVVRAISQRVVACSPIVQHRVPHP
jgi:hypothetical protein